MPESPDPALSYAASAHALCAANQVLEEKIRLLATNPAVIDQFTVEMHQELYEVIADVLSRTRETLSKNAEYTLETHEMILDLASPYKK